MGKVDQVTRAETDSLVEVLDLDRIETNIFRGWSWHTAPTRVFGGHVAAQALIAAGRTVAPDRPVHSLHAYFLLPGDPAAPIIYDVDLIRDGRSFTTRRVVAIQHGRAIFNLSASFQRATDGLEHQSPMPPSPPPDGPSGELGELGEFAKILSNDENLSDDENVEPFFSRYLDVRLVATEGPDGSIQQPVWSSHGEPHSPHQRMWFRARGTLPADPLYHVCAVAYASDLRLITTTLLPHRSTNGRTISLASLDHAMWFHRPFRADDWLLYIQESPSASGSRGFARGEIYTADGKLVVSVAQEGLMRVDS
ncbi:choloyl-CoA hydrolase [Candidatus Protofrankia californiensis]|uniref:Acyl-CoA thioesterase 2 n=1 Tax=Candidatus Protofrankia californiensis TaxID=1839754 RepID=A0A1C3P6M5_9ACTN|nr:choloyl-CoA hydrolase [Candidatus Protofrankia californiensis]